MSKEAARIVAAAMIKAANDGKKVNTAVLRNQLLLIKAASDPELLLRMEKTAFKKFIAQNLRGIGRSIRDTFRRPAAQIPSPPPVQAPRPGMPAQPRIPASAHHKFHQRPTVPPVAPITPPAAAFRNNIILPTQASPVFSRAGARRTASPPTAPVPPQSAPPGFSRNKVLKRLLGLGAATVGGGHLYNDAQNRTDWSVFNPFTWSEQRPTEENIFMRGTNANNAASERLRGEITKAFDAGDLSKWQELKDKLQAGDYQEDTGYNPLNWRMGGLNPFSSAERGASIQARMLQQQKVLQGKLDAELAKSGPQPGDAELVKSLQERLDSADLLPHQAQAINEQLAQVKERMSKPGTLTDAGKLYKQRMNNASMRIRLPDGFEASGGVASSAPGGASSAPGGASTEGLKPYSGWNLGGRPRVPGYMSGAALLPGDFRPPQQAWDSVQSQNSPFMPG